MLKGRLYFIFIVFCVISAQAKAQVLSAPQNSPLSQAAPSPKKGTYQIVLKPGTDKTDLPPNVILSIEATRDQNEIKYIQVDANTKVRILPVSTISDPNFIAPEEYVYEP